MSGLKTALFLFRVKWSNKAVLPPKMCKARFMLPQKPCEPLFTGRYYNVELDARYAEEQEKISVSCVACCEYFLSMSLDKVGIGY